MHKFKLEKFYKNSEMTLRAMLQNVFFFNQIKNTNDSKSFIPIDIEFY